VGSDSDRLVHWCHGAPGLCLLLIKASSVFQATDHNSAQKYTAMAMKLADEVVWPRGLLKKGTGLCHGISGNGYVLLQLSKSLEGSTASEKWYKRAFMYASFAVANLNELKHVPDRPFSLYEGIAGLACYLLDCCDRGTGKSAFPLYEYS
jgi:lantibiotic modifying enzyme